jgi:hypothetical protein
VLGLPLTVIINIKSNVSSENRTQGLTNLAYIRNPQHNHLTIVACLALFLFALGTVAVAVHDKAHSRVTLPAHSFHPHHHYHHRRHPRLLTSLSRRHRSVTPPSHRSHTHSHTNQRARRAESGPKRCLSSFGPKASFFFRSFFFY